MREKSSTRVTGCDILGGLSYNKGMKKKILSLKKRTVQHPSRRFTLWVIVLGAAVATLLAAWIGLRQSVWFDEAYSILLAKQPIGELIRLTAADTHPPMYYLLLKAWGEMFGWTDLAMRSLSLLAYGGSIIFAGLLMRRLFSDRVALISVIFLVFAPLLARYGFEIRMYALGSLIGVAATYVMVEARRHTGRVSYLLWALYAVLVAAGTLTLYYIVLLWAAHLVWLMIVERPKLKTLLKKPWVWAYTGAVVLFAPWLSVFVGQMTNGALAPIGQKLTFDQLAGILSFNFLYKPVWQLDILDTIALIFIIAACGYLVVRAFKETKHRQGLLLLACYILVPIAIVMAISFVRPMYVERYLAHVAIGLILLVAASVEIVALRMSTRSGRLMAGFLLVLLFVGWMNLGSVGNYNFQRLHKPRLSELRPILQACGNGATVVAADPYVATELSYYAPDDCHVRFHSETEKLSGGYAPWSESVNRVDNPVPPLAPTLYYVYYDEPKLEIDKSYTVTNTKNYGPLHVTEYHR